jgi:hypothetical protein
MRRQVSARGIETGHLSRVAVSMHASTFLRLKRQRAVPQHTEYQCAVRQRCPRGQRAAEPFCRERLSGREPRDLRFYCRQRLSSNRGANNVLRRNAAGLARTHRLDLYRFKPECELTLDEYDALLIYG